MPIYEYVCLKCNNIFSALQRLGTSEKETFCPACGSADVRKKVSAFSYGHGGGTSSSPSFSGYSGGG